MPDSNKSLILKERAKAEDAPFLFSEEEIPRIDKTRPKFHCTGERLFRDRPDVYKAAVRMLAEPGVSVRSICATLHVTDDTVQAVKARENIAIATEKKTLLSNLTHGARLASERVIEMMPSASAKDALLGVGILTDKLQLLSGEVTACVEHRERIDLFSDWPDFVRSLEKPAQAREIDSSVRQCSPAFEAWIEKNLPGGAENDEKTRLASGNNFLTESGVENLASGDGAEDDSRPHISGAVNCSQKAPSDNTAASQQRRGGDAA